MLKAVRFEKYGGIDVLKIVDVDRPVPQVGQVLVQVKAAGINPGEVAIREGWFAELFPATFPSGEGSDFAGVVVELGSGVDGFAVGDEVIGFTHNRASHAEFVVAEATNLTPKPSGVSWEQAGALFIAGTTAYATVRSVSLRSWPRRPRAVPELGTHRSGACALRIISAPSGASSYRTRRGMVSVGANAKKPLMRSRSAATSDRPSSRSWPQNPGSNSR
jgi:D-arabinose 1-dehydrogenase-like Zn-dependent alcohol dehydrogenase